MITNIPFEIARDIAYFELHKKLTALNKQDSSGSTASKMAAMGHLFEYEVRTRAIFDGGIEKAELTNIVVDFKTNPISLTSCGTPEKRQYMIDELELLLTGDYDQNGFILRLIQAYGYTKNEAETLQEQLFNEIRRNDQLVLSVFDKANERCKELNAK